MEGIFIPTLTSPRLVLRRLRADDHADLFALANDPEVTRYLNEGPPPSEEDVWQRMAVALGQWDLRGYGMMVVEDQAGFAGRIGFFHPFAEPEPLLVYALCRRAWGKGYAGEAVAAIRDWMFSTHKPARLISHIMPENVASARVAAKLGALPAGRTVRQGAELDVWVYSPRGAL